MYVVWCDYSLAFFTTGTTFVGDLQKKMGHNYFTFMLILGSE